MGLSILKFFMSKTGLVILLIIGAFGTGWYGHYRWVKGDIEEAKVESLENYIAQKKEIDDENRELEEAHLNEQIAKQKWYRSRNKSLSNTLADLRSNPVKCLDDDGLREWNKYNRGPTATNSISSEVPRTTP